MLRARYCSGIELLILSPDSTCKRTYKRMYARKHPEIPGMYQTGDGRICFIMPGEEENSLIVQSVVPFISSWEELWAELENPTPRIDLQSPRFWGLYPPKKMAIILEDDLYILSAKGDGFGKFLAFLKEKYPQDLHKEVLKDLHRRYSHQYDIALERAVKKMNRRDKIEFWLYRILTKLWHFRQI